MLDIVEKYFDDNNIEYVRLDKKACCQIQQKWRDVYSAQMKTQKGGWGDDNYEWNTFAQNYAVNKKGARARALYHDIPWKDSVLYVVLEDANGIAWKCYPKRLPDFSLELSNIGCIDLYVFPEDLSWTMAFTHEESIDMGPYFAMKEWQE